MSNLRSISPQAVLHEGQGRPEWRPDPPYLVAPSPDEEEELNFKVLEFLENAEKHMNTEGPDKAPRWASIRKLMKRMQEAFPYLINNDTNLKLPHKKKYGNLTVNVRGPLDYSLFKAAFDTDTTIKDYHKYIVEHVGPIGEGDHRRESLWAEDVLRMLYSALKYELKRHWDDMHDQDYDDETEEAPANNVVQMPHFGMVSNNSTVRDWKKAYELLTNRDWINSKEVSEDEWLYVCCGIMTPPKGPIVWLGPTAALAYIVRKHFGGQWDLAQKIFCLKNGKPFPVSFNSTHDPAQKTVNAINRNFPPTNSH